LTIGLIFRHPEDLFKERSMPTPDGTVMLANPNKFITKWKAVQFEGWKLINAKVENEFEKLSKHIIKGCLSGILVGMGTNRNESLHKYLKQFGKPRLSVRSALAILTHVFYVINTRKSGTAVVPPI